MNVIRKEREQNITISGSAQWVCVSSFHLVLGEVVSPQWDQGGTFAYFQLFQSLSYWKIGLMSSKIECKPKLCINHQFRGY